MCPAAEALVEFCRQVLPKSDPSLRNLCNQVVRGGWEKKRERSVCDHTLLEESQSNAGVGKYIYLYLKRQADSSRGSKTDWRLDQLIYRLPGALDLIQARV
jgi:hypothetical protein